MQIISSWPVGGKRLELVQGDITRFKAGAIVNAANSRLAGGGGVDGAIHAAAGKQLSAACSRWIAVHGSLPAGQAMITDAFNLPAKYIIHTVGPIWQGGNNNEHKTLRNAYNACLALCDQNEIHHIAFPAISCGVYGFPVEEAAPLALQCTIDNLQQAGVPSKISFVLYNKPSCKKWLTAARDVSELS
ncbi:macro domain-containing protein [Oleidesulfovibrio sp.]|uniref:macro domain-containing protein n=1 Tax=Oleidesulfovibrio sp. TaxID=2909707 RepID=UPI003A85039D